MSGRRVFLDVGGHLGETLAIAQDPRWGFEKIYSFEPAPQCWDALESTAGDRTEVLRFGLWSRDADMRLHDPGEIGASLFDGKALSDVATDVHVRDASAWFESNIDAADDVVMKVNCEGAECELLDRLLETGQALKIKHLVVHFDVRKVPDLGWRESTTRTALRAAGISYLTAEQVLIGRNVSEKTRNWLDWYQSGPVRRLRHIPLRRAEFFVRTRVYRIRTRFGTPYHEASTQS